MLTCLAFGGTCKHLVKGQYYTLRSYEFAIFGVSIAGDSIAPKDQILKPILKEEPHQLQKSVGHFA